MFKDINHADMRGERMSILIKGLGMPKSCKDCIFKREKPVDIAVCLITKSEERTFKLGMFGSDVPKRMGDCPLVEVPTPHGDLIDVDAIDIYDADSEWNYYNDEYTAFSLTAIKAQPSVIPAEEGEYEYDEE